MQNRQKNIKSTERSRSRSQSKEIKKQAQHRQTVVQQEKEQTRSPQQIKAKDLNNEKKFDDFLSKLKQITAQNQLKKNNDKEDKNEEKVQNVEKGIEYFQVKEYIWKQCNLFKSSTWDEIYSIFKKMPKPADLHTHFLSVISYNDIIQDLKINNQVRYSQLYFGEEIYEITKQLAIFFQNKRPKQVFEELPMRGNEQKFYQKLIKHLEVIFSDRKISHQERILKRYYNSMQFTYYHLNESAEQYLRYIDLIIQYMNEHCIQYIEIRKTINEWTQDVFNYIEKRDDYKNKIRFILQFPKNDQKLAKKLIMQALTNRQLLDKQLIIGIDLVGLETIEIKSDILNDEKILQLMKENGLQFYMHAGESFEIDTICQQNVDKILEHYKTHPELYRSVFRIGHGISHLSKYQVLNETEKDILFEVIPLSNKFFLNQDFPIDLIRRHYNNIVICSDDLNKSEMNLTDNFTYLYEKGLREVYIYQTLLLNSIKGMNNTDSQKKKIRTEFITQFDQWIANYNKILNLSDNIIQLKKY